MPATSAPGGCGARCGPARGHRLARARSPAGGGHRARRAECQCASDEVGGPADVPCAASAQQALVHVPEDAQRARAQAEIGADSVAAAHHEAHSEQHLEGDQQVAPPARRRCPPSRPARAVARDGSRERERGAQLVCTVEGEARGLERLEQLVQALSVEVRFALRRGTQDARIASGCAHVLALVAVGGGVGSPPPWLVGGARPCACLRVACRSGVSPWRRRSAGSAACPRTASARARRSARRLSASSRLRDCERSSWATATTRGPARISRRARWASLSRAGGEHVEHCFHPRGCHVRVLAAGTGGAAAAKQHLGAGC